MATALHLCGVKTPSCTGISNRSLHCGPLSSQHLNFPLSVPLGSGLRKTIKDSCRRRVLRVVSCEGGTVDVLERDEMENQSCDGVVEQFTCVMKFGGSSVASAERMREVAELILSFPSERPIIVLSAMGKTTNKLLLAGERAVSCGVSNVMSIDELSFVKELHLRTVDELGIDRSIISMHQEELEQLLKGIALTKELTPRTKDYLVSFGECMSTRIFAAHLNKIGAKARQYDEFDIGFITTGDFTNVDILEATYPAVAKRLLGDYSSDPAIPVVTGFLGKIWRSCAATTLGWGDSDLTATTLGKALGLREIQVWRDVDGILTCDPSIYPRAEPVPYLTSDDAAEHAYFGGQVLHPQSMRPAREGDIPVRVKNSITRDRDISKALLTSIVLKLIVNMSDIVSTRMLGQFGFLTKVFSTFKDSGIYNTIMLVTISNIIVTMLDIVSTRMLGQFGFLAKVFSILKDFGISVHVVATNEVRISLTLDPSKFWSRELCQQVLLLVSRSQGALLLRLRILRHLVLPLFVIPGMQLWIRFLPSFVGCLILLFVLLIIRLR